MWNKTNNLIEEYVLNIIRSDSFLEHRIDAHLAFMRKQFGNFEEVSENVMRELDSFVIESPQEVVELSKNLFRKQDRLGTMMRMARIGKKKNATPIDTIEKISNFHEVSSVLKMGAYLLSNRRATLVGLKDENKAQILKHFSRLGLTHTEIENVRLVRNASSHLMRVQENKIVFENQSSLRIEEIEELWKKVDNISSWWFTLIVTAIWHNPKFGFLAFFGIIGYIMDCGEDFTEFTEGIKFFFPDVLAQQQEEEKRKRKLSLKRRFIRLKYKVPYKYRKYFMRMHYRQPFYLRHFEEVNLHLIRHSELIANTLASFCDKLQDQKDIERMNSIKDWFKKRKANLRKYYGSISRIWRCNF